MDGCHHGRVGPDVGGPPAGRYAGTIQFVESFIIFVQQWSSCQQWNLSADCHSRKRFHGISQSEFTTQYIWPHWDPQLEVAVAQDEAEALTQTKQLLSLSPQHSAAMYGSVRIWFLRICA